MLRFTGHAWNVERYYVAQFERAGEIVYGFGIDAHDMNPHRLYKTVEEALAEAIAFKLTGVEPRAFGPGTGSAARWFLAACEGAAYVGAAN